MKPDTKAILARAEAATPGPWTFERVDLQTEGMAETTFQHIRSGPHGVADTWHTTPLAIKGFGPLSGYLPPRHGKANDAKFIAHARTDVPALCRRVEELEAALQDLLDEQNGPPLARREAQWRSAVERARAALEGKS